MAYVWVQPRPPTCAAMVNGARPQEGQAEGVCVSRLSLTKPSWVVRTQSNVRRRKAEGGCVVCDGTGKVDCYNCYGKGRTNCMQLEVLPRGEWPRWCRSCGGSGLGYCSRCLGTGEYRYVMGFRFMKGHADDG